ncbi:MAG: MlaD family protein [Fibromonadaceae bacterium]|jgi:phospholipid/cholesterol/gamma-HCH transport system substrate-binding protein|nr:MlaD family protein [Fibromonadaceae bacterium]
MKKVQQNRPWLFYGIVFFGVLCLFSLWFFLHPKSPWHERHYYKVAFSEVGNLKKGNSVNVNGLPKGYVKRIELTDSCVWTEVAVLANVKIPKDSRMHVANAGLMGERVIEISLGNSTSYYEDGAQIMGFFDMGSTTIGYLIVDIVEEAEAIIDILSNTMDTLFSEEKIESYKRLEKKAKLLGNRATYFVNTAEKSLVASFDSLVLAKDKIVEIVDDIKPDLDGAVKHANELEKNYAELEKTLGDFQKSIVSIAKRIESDTTTIALVFDDGGDLKLRMSSISGSAEKLLEKIKRRGLDLNVDLF